MKLFKFLLILNLSKAFSYPYYPLCSTDTTNNTILTTLNGQIKGECYNISINYASKPFNTIPIIIWLKVPFAEAPIDTNRFKNPIPIKNWTGVLDGTKLSQRCIPGPAGYLENIGEDCLYVNIYTPFKTVLDTTSKTPIFIWIHGGTFMYGDSLEENNEPATFVAMSNVIVVSINYRLASFGFLYIKDTEANGNQGMLDQLLALKWVHENAHTFGGDANRITIGGDSAGGFSVSFHLINKLSWPYFNNAIIESGNILDYNFPLITVDEAIKRSNSIADKIGCLNQTNQEIFNCLQLVNSTLLSQIANDYLAYPLLVLDGSFIQKQPSELYKNGLIKPCAILIGFNTKEVGYFVGPNTDQNEMDSTGNYYFLFAILKNYYINYPFKEYFPAIKTQDDFINEMINQYISPEQRLNLTAVFYDLSIDITTDSSFKFPTIQQADYMSQLNRNVYVYSYGHHIETSPWKSKYEAVHTEELYMFFAEPLSVKKEPILNDNPYSSVYFNYSVEDRLISEKLVTYRANFIHFGNPNGLNSTEWPLFKTKNDSVNRKILLLNNVDSKVVNFKLDNKQYLFWTSFIMTSNAQSTHLVNFFLIILMNLIIYFK